MNDVFQMAIRKGHSAQFESVMLRCKGVRAEYASNKIKNRNVICIRVDRHIRDRLKYVLSNQDVTVQAFFETLIQDFLREA